MQMNRTVLSWPVWAVVLTGGCLCQVPKRVISRPWDSHAETSLELMKHATKLTQRASDVPVGPRDEEVQRSAVGCIAALFNDLVVHGPPTGVGRFNGEGGDSWVFSWSVKQCHDSAICLAGITDTPRSTIADVRLPAGSTLEVLNRSLRWATAPIHLTSLSVYVQPGESTASTIALVGGVTGSERLGGFGMWGVVETGGSQRTMRLQLGKMHCRELYPKDLYFTSRRFVNVMSEASGMTTPELVAVTKVEMRRHNYIFPDTQLGILLDELSTRGVPTEVLRDLLHSAIWPLDEFSSSRLYSLTHSLLRSTGVAKRSAGILEQEILPLLETDQPKTVEENLYSHANQVVDTLFKVFQFRDDDVSIEEIALQLVVDRRFTKPALRYLEVKATSEGVAESLLRKSVAPEFESTRDLTGRRIKERFRTIGVH